MERIKDYKELLRIDCKEEKKQLLIGDTIQCKLSEELGCTLEEFTEYYSEAFKKQYNKFLVETGGELTAAQLTEFKNFALAYLIRQYFAGKVEDIIEEK